MNLLLLSQSDQAMQYVRLVNEMKMDGAHNEGFIGVHFMSGEICRHLLGQRYNTIALDVMITWLLRRNAACA